MFNDHNIFSNNLHDAANKLRQIQEANVRSAEDLALIRKKEQERIEREEQIKGVPSHEAIRTATERTSGMAGREGRRREQTRALQSKLIDLHRAGDSEGLEAAIKVLGDMERGNKMGEWSEKSAGNSEQVDALSARENFRTGQSDMLPPATTQELKLAAKIMSGRYRAPYQQEPVAMSPDASDDAIIPDIGNEGSSQEVQQDAAIRSTGTDPRSAAIRQQPPMSSSTGMTPEDMAVLRQRVSGMAPGRFKYRRTGNR